MPRKRSIGMSDRRAAGCPQGKLGYALSLVRGGTTRGNAGRRSASTCGAPPTPACRPRCICSG